MRISAFGMLLIMLCTGQTPPVNRLATVVDDAAERAMTVKLAPGVVVLVASHGRVIFLRGYGVRDLKSRRPVTPSTHFEIGSVTKQFTATAIMQLLDVGKLSLDDPLSKYVPTYTVGASVTIRQLLWQTSGIPNYVESPDIMKLASTVQPSLQGVLSLITGKPLRFTPGTQWAYSNTNYFLLARIIEVASGETYQQYLRKYIFELAGMTDTGFVSDERRFSDMASGYISSNGAPAPSPNFFGGWAAGAGDIVSTSPDMLKWDNALLAGKVVGLPYVTMMRTSGTLMSGKLTGYGMGWYIEKQKSGVVTIWHNGGTFGFSADNNTYPNSDMTIIVLDNNIAADAENVAAEIFEGIRTMGPANAAETPFSELEFRSIGPNPGRLDAVAGVPGDMRIYYVGGLGGLFKSDDGGASFASIFDQPDVSSVGAIAVAPSNPNVIYIGTGEPNVRNDIESGNGVWRSGDAGKTWNHIGLDRTAHIAQVAIDPHDPNVVYVAAEGPIYGAGTQRGVYKSIDGGKTWQHALGLDDRTGASSVVLDPSLPTTVFAGMWTVWRKPWMLNSGGPDDGLYVSRDAGLHWTKATGHGLPSGLMGRIGLAYAPSNPRRIYALIESREGVLWRSDDGGSYWTLVSRNHALQQRPFYYSELSVDPSDQDHVYFISVDLLESHDGGKSSRTLSNELGDNHQMWIDPLHSTRLAMVSDFSVGISFDGAQHWIYPQIPIAQTYHVATDSRTPYTVCGEFQDAGSACGPSNSKSGGIRASDWFNSLGGESGSVSFDPMNRNIIYGSGYQGTLTRFDTRTNQARSISPWPLDTMGWPARDLRYRFQWAAPIAVSPLEPRALYFGANVLFKSDDEGMHWRVISPDVTRNDKSKQRPTGGPITLDATGVEAYDTIFSIAESPRKRGEVWLGTDDGLVWLTRDDGVHWKNLTPLISSMPSWARVTSIEPSAFDSATAYISVDTHLLGDRLPCLYVTHDYGEHWKSIVGDLSNASYSAVLKEDPFRRGLLYLGTGFGLYISFDDGEHWTRMQGLPTVPIYDVVVQPGFDDLVVGTHGRGIYILDDLHPLQEYTVSLAGRALALFSTRTAYRWSTGRSTFAFDTQLGRDPTYGGYLDFWMREAPSANQQVTVDVYSGATLVRSLDVQHAQAGINRVIWDLRYAGFRPVKDSAPWRMGGFAGPLAVPGTYRFVVHALGKVQTGTIEVAADPQARTSMVALRAQFTFQMRIHSDLARIGEAIDRLRAADGRQAKALLERLYQPQVTEAGDILRHPTKLYERLSSLATQAESADQAPTTADAEALRELEAQMDAALLEARSVLAR